MLCVLACSFSIVKVGLYPKNAYKGIEIEAIKRNFTKNASKICIFEIFIVILQSK